MAKILVVEDDLATGLLIQTWMEHIKHVVELVDDGNEAIDRLRIYSYDLVVLDWNLPGKNGIEICKAYRSAGGRAPLLMLTSKSSIEDKSEGLYGGADDYLTKPFDVKELTARVAALLRRPASYTADIVEIGQIKIDKISNTVYVDGKEVRLVPKEYALLETFMRHPNQLFSADRLIELIWSSESDTTASVVKAHIYNLRKKLGNLSSPLIENIHSKGYKLHTGI